VINKDGFILFTYYSSVLLFFCFKIAPRNVVYRGKLTSTRWYHFWRGNLARSHFDDISSAIVLISFQV